MSQYMLLLYATEVGGEELAERESEIPTMWLELNRSLEEAGLLVAAGRLHPTTTATTVSAIPARRSSRTARSRLLRRRLPATT